MVLLQLLVTVFALLMVALTMFLRAHELKDKGFQWNLRRAGLVLAGVGCLWMVMRLCMLKDHASLAFTCMSVGVFLVFLTTPNGIPWHRWVWRGIGADDLPPTSLRADRESEINRQRDIRP